MSDYRQFAKSILIRSTPERVWTALTDSQVMTVWLAEHVVMEPTLGGRFAVWGHGTHGTAITLDNPGAITYIEPNRRLTIEMTLMGFPARTTFSLEPSDRGTVIRAEYELPNNSESMPFFLSQDHAIVLLYNLRSYVETGSPALLPDPPLADRAPRMSITISADPSDAFAALTVPEVMNKWLSSDATVDLRVGGQYSYGWTEKLPSGEVVPAGPVEIVALEPGHRLKHNWQYSTESPTQVEWIVEGEAGSTTVKLTHSGFGENDDVPAYVQGWAAFMLILQSMLEGKPMVE